MEKWALYSLKRSVNVGLLDLLCCPEAADEGFTSSLEVVCMFYLHTDSKTRTSLDDWRFSTFLGLLQPCKLRGALNRKSCYYKYFVCVFCICAVFLCKHTTELEVLTLFNQLRALLSFFLLGSSFVYTEVFFDICSWSIRDHSCCLFNHLYLQSFLRHWPSSLVLVHPGQSYLVQLLYGLSAFFTTSRHQRHDAVQSTWRWSLYLHCYIGDQRGWWQRQLQVHDHTCRNTPAFLLSSSQDCQDDRDVGEDLMYFIWLFYHLQRA